MMSPLILSLLCQTLLLLYGEKRTLASGGNVNNQRSKTYSVGGKSTAQVQDTKRYMANSSTSNSTYNDSSPNVTNAVNNSTPFLENRTKYFNNKIATVIQQARTLCSFIQTLQRDEYVVMADNQSAVYIKKTGAVLSSKYYYTNGISVNDSQASILICFKYRELSDCSISIDEVVFPVVNSSFISDAPFLHASLSIRQRRSLCGNIGGLLSTTKKISSKNNNLLSILTFICMLTSITALGFVLVTYFLFAELRTPPGVSLINLSLSILLSQLLWILGSKQTKKSLACVIVAVFLHYIFLVSFVWTSIIAFDTWRTFTAKTRRALVESKQKKHCLKRMAVAWMSVMVYVAICFVVDNYNVVAVQYGSEDVCWITNGNAKIYFFVAPAGLLMIFNIIFFCLTVKAIKYTHSQTKRIEKSARKREFYIYVRIATMMGFTWIFGFAAPFGRLFLFYIFVVLNSLQGLYIAFAFVVNKRVRKLYVDLFQKRQLSMSNRSNERNKIFNCFAVCKKRIDVKEHTDISPPI